ncbi:hypothetical protein BXT84_09715 [Sulfobacillus thermotolerans]|uniref:Uncharacterized protein n=1 Tax=Sulfobacillus thermotolerans TaxID=338644 RepID=A0ABM6RS71_9FIRM|nr:hypothetical protein BXT84_09715 [Sulfobacillus thermotolerans]
MSIPFCQNGEIMADVGLPGFSVLMRVGPGIMFEMAKHYQHPLFWTIGHDGGKIKRQYTVFQAG